MIRFRQSVWLVMAVGGCDDGAGQASSDAGPADVEISAAAPVAAPDRCRNAGTPGATATCLAPAHPPAHYVDQAERYFDTLDVDADRARIPDYAVDVARWEWPPWLLLTGLGSDDMTRTANALRDLDPSTVPVRDCRFFEAQPFARCYISFEYERGACPIYEEFTFNAAGQVTFIEAWSDLPGLTPITDPDDPWGERGTVARLSTRVPGLGTPDGALDLESRWMTEAAAEDADLADFALRASDWWMFWFQALAEAPDDFFGTGCGWPPETR
jgi:hypothetical protein